jgi:hypothetical protein
MLKTTHEATYEKGQLGISLRSVPLGDLRQRADAFGAASGTFYGLICAEIP